MVLLVTHQVAQQRRPTVSQAELGKASPTGQGKWLVPSAQSWWDTSDVLDQGQGSPGQARNTFAGKNLVQDCGDDEVVGTCVAWAEDEKAGRLPDVVSSWESYEYV